MFYCLERIGANIKDYPKNSQHSDTWLMYQTLHSNV